MARGSAWIDAHILQEFTKKKELVGAGFHFILLTEREITVLGLLQRGFCNKEIAAQLRRTVPTVKFHIKNIYAKLKVHDRAEAVEWAKRSGALKPALENASGS